MENNLIVVKQLPIIEEQLRGVKAAIEARISAALSLACTEETYKEVKKERAQLSSEFAELENRRKEVKKAILSPYEQFEALYKECVGDIYRNADQQLRDKISAVENGIKQERLKWLVAYFKEYRTSKGIDEDMIKFEDAGITVTMTASKKGLQAAASAFIDHVADDLALIETMEHKDEILVEYRASKNLSRAVMTVNRRHQAIEEAARRRAETEKAKKEQLIAAAAVLQAAQRAPEEQNIGAPVPTQTTLIEPSEVEKRYSAAFKVEGTIPQLRALKAFLVEGGYTWETIR